MRGKCVGKELGSWLFLVSVLWLLAGCVGSEYKADRAMEVGNYSIALEMYEEAIQSSDQDPDLYLRAARAAQRQGAFAKAERYFSQSLRYGGDVAVARELAEFYVQTSNFTQAARIFQYLVHIEDDVQPLYSNIGTALMYGGQYLDAESYLLLAQQMDPGDAVPYINLGVLYDRHLRNRPKAVLFYKCYSEMSGDTRQVRTVKNRLREIENQGPVDTSRVNLTCGEEYRYVEQEHRDLREAFGIPFDEEAEVELPLDYNPSEIVPEFEVPEFFEDRQQEEGDDEDGIRIRVIDYDTDESFEDSDGDSVFAEAEDAYDAGRYDRTVELLEQRPAELLSIEEKRLLGESYYRVGRFVAAAQSLQGVLEERPRPELAQRLIEVYERAGDEEGKRRVCERFSDWPDYVQALDACH